jgi:MFS family permease
MKIDLVGPRLRGTAMGFNEAAGSAAMAATAWATGAIAEVAGLRPAPFFLGLAVAAIGLGLSVVYVRDTRTHAALEAATHDRRSDRDLNSRQVFAMASWRDRTLSSACRAGLVNNLNEGVAWGLLPILFAAGGLDLATVGGLVAIAPAVWGFGQLLTGALSDRVGRKPLIVLGQFGQAAGLIIIALGSRGEYWVAGSIVFGAGTALAYPTLIAAVSDVAHPSWRGAAVGVYRLWRDIGFALGAVLAGIVADLYSIETAIVVVAAITAASGFDVAWRMRETLVRQVDLSARNG